MSNSSNKRSEEFLAISDQFKLGVLVTESSHPVTQNLSEVAANDTAAGLAKLFEVDEDVLRKFRQFVESGRADSIKESVVKSLRNGGRIFFTGCGSTGRLSIQLVSIWRDFWQQQTRNGMASANEFANRAFSVMAGGDFALIKSVEGFEDFAEFGKKQIAELGVRSGDVVFAITEGGETSFVIGTAWRGLEAGAKVYFVYNNPDDILCQHVRRSREIIEEPRVEKINLTTGPMAITGSTRMQATTIQLCVLLTILEMAVTELLQGSEGNYAGRNTAEIPGRFLSALTATHTALKSADVLASLARLVALEESVYRAGHKNNYYADRFGIDVLTDTTERSPTYCTPPFRKFDDTQAAESWTFLFLPCASTEEAWRYILKRQPKCVEWSDDEVRKLVPPEKADRTWQIVQKISCPELMRFRIGMDGLPHRQLHQGDSAVGIVCETEKDSLLSPFGFVRTQLDAARRSGARTGIVCFGGSESLDEIARFAVGWDPECVLVTVPLPKTNFLLNGVARAGVKMVLNALSTCTMVRLGRVMGNYMIWVVASNLKLIDRATRYIQKLADLSYADANRLLFEVVEYIEPRMKADKAYPPVVGMAVLRARHQLTNEQAEQRLNAG